MARILIVEDYESLQVIYSTVLKHAGHEVVVVNDGFMALEQLKESQFDLILLDLLLPHMSGIEFLQALDRKKYPKLKVIVCSNFTSPKLIQAANNLGAAHHLTKSNLSPQEVADMVAQTLQEP